jgi:hypothetical protein
MECYLIPICHVLLGTSLVKDPERKSHSLGARKKKLRSMERKKKKGRRT